MHLIIYTDSYNKPTSEKNCTRQHLVDLDSAAFTCNVPFYGKPFLRGIILQDCLYGKQKDFNLEFQFSRVEVLIEDLPAKDQAKVYGYFQEKDLTDIWRYVLDSSNGTRFNLLCRDFKEYLSFRKKYLHDDSIPIMLIEFVPRQIIYKTAPKNKKKSFVGNVMPVEIGGYQAPLLIQSKAVIAQSKNKVTTKYGQFSLDDEHRNWQGAFVTHSSLQEKLFYLQYPEMHFHHLYDQ